MSIEAMKQALVALGGNSDEYSIDAKIALRAAIAEAEKCEPVGYIWRTHSGELKFAEKTSWNCWTPVPAWHPIETAPKDGGVILLGLPAIGALKDADQRRVYEGLWSDMQMRFTSVNGFIVLDCATHWMPLPAAPKER